MLDKLKTIQTKLVEFWNRFTSKQKTLIISIAAAVLFTLVALIVLLNRTKYVELVSFDNTTDAAAAKEILDERQIKYNVSGSGLTFSVDENSESDARLALGENNIATSKDDSETTLFETSMSTTDEERQLKKKIYLQTQISNDLQQMDNIKQASVQITIPDSSNALLADEKQASASVMLVTADDISEDRIEGIANYVSTALGNKDASTVRIIDQTGALLYRGDSDGSTSASSVEKTNKNTEIVTSGLEDRVRSLLVNAGLYNDAQVAANLDLNLDDESFIDQMYYTNDGEEDTGPMSSYYYYTAENADGTAGIPGTDSNDDTPTDYDIVDGNTANSSVNVYQNKYDTSLKTTTVQRAIGTYNRENSSIAVMLNKYVVYDEAKMKKAGQLKGTDFETFQSENEEKTLIEVDEETYSMVSMATGIPTESIQIQAYEVPLFYPQETSAVDTVANYLQFILAILIVALLCFVVFKGMKPVEVTELEPELSVEALLATTKENQTLEDIEFSDKSATRQQIERFVDESPEEVALLLRNWLNDEWD